MFNFLNVFKKQEPLKWHYPGDFVITSESLKNTILYGDVVKRENLVFCAGIDAHGKRTIIDLERAPHMLVGGVPGFGKSVFVNSVLFQLLIKNSPDDLQLYIVDPKKVDYIKYRYLPHVKQRASDNTEIINLLHNLHDVMMHRFAIMEAENVDNIRKCKAHFPQIVLVFDEFSSLDKSPELKEIYHQVEIIAKLGRASGIHCIISLQNPKATNISTSTRDNVLLRVAFHTASKSASRVILENNDVNASELTIPGDGYIKNVDGSITRFQGCYTKDSELDGIVKWWANQPNRMTYEQMKTEYNR